eukprot:NODE_5169_length_974_cov_46.391304_g4959_i0.p1 GENE.NODE_5169_length_974_cov_46.391304_g4959_i0~~NODE_5169_length_974_cov_46.391304_g4959_i0.p1  ORF type:complete len:291 (+),score=79.54 NODE_5169_length_974_cov_46.391304_g4959_i0:65-874(+)
MPLTIAEDAFAQVLGFLPLKYLLRCGLVNQEWRERIQKPAIWASRSSSLSKTREAPAEDLFDDWECLEFVYWRPGTYEPQEDDYVFKPLPVKWACGVHTNLETADLVDKLGDHEHMHFVKAMHLLITLKTDCDKVGATCQSEGESPIHPIIIRWTSDSPPSAQDMVTAFNINPEVAKAAHDDAADKNSFYGTFGVFDTEEEEEEEESDNDEKDKNDAELKKFRSRVLALFTPSQVISIGDRKINPVVRLHLVNLAPGWWGGMIGSMMCT